METSEIPKSANLPGDLTPICLVVITGDHVPSFKNRKRCGHTEKKVKQRMTQLENRIVSVLYSACQTPKSGTETECLQRFRTALSGLSDDSLKVIPESSFGVRYVEPGLEGVEITIEKLNL